MKNFDVKDKVIVVTGAGGVICSSFAKDLLERGAKVALLDINEDNLKRVGSELSSLGTLLTVKCNVLEKKSIEGAKEEINKAFGKCDVLINGAGGNHPKGTTSNEYFNKGDEALEDVTSFFDLDPDGVEFVFNLNFIGSLLPSQVFMKDMIGRSGCSVINISSMNAFTPLTKIPAYSGAKAAISNFTQWLAVHFAKEGIRVNAMAPGFFETNQNKKLLRNDDGSLTERANKIVTATPMGRFGEIAELNGTLLWLIDENFSKFVTGVVVPIDGGFSAYSGV